MKKVNESWFIGRNVRRVDMEAKYKNFAEMLLNERDFYKNRLIPWDEFFILLDLPHNKNQRFEHRNAINKTLRKMKHADVYLRNKYGKGIRVYYDNQAVVQLSLFRQQREQSAIQLSINEYEAILPHIKSQKQKMQVKSLLQIAHGMKALSDANELTE